MSDYFEKIKEGKARFLKEVANHKMTVRHNSGIYRNLVFSDGDNYLYRFEITTWPNYLAITGDVGTFVFARMNDMFSFFRGQQINPDYWAEKLTAASTYKGYQSFDFELLKEAVTNEFNGWSFDNEEDRQKSWESIVDEWDGLFAKIYDGDKSYAINEVLSWKCSVSGKRFNRFLEQKFEGYTHQFLWCCYAIQWAIEVFETASRDSGKAA